MARAGASRIIRYFIDMGIDGGFAARLLGRPIDQFDYIDHGRQFHRAADLLDPAGGRERECRAAGR